MSSVESQTFSEYGEAGDPLRLAKQWFAPLVVDGINGLKQTKYDAAQR